jgi:hypothetical protein
MNSATAMTAKPTLRSRAFRDVHRLQLCLTEDRSHIPLGSIGDHVVRIQQALTVLGEVPYELWPHFEIEARAKHYGAATARAVLLYKTKRNIINRIYQSSPDNIVGKMTITSLDQEMVEYERTHFLVF